MLAPHGGTRDGLEAHPDPRAGAGPVRGDAGTAPVGSHDDVAARIHEYGAPGIEECVLSGHPHLEEAHRCGEGMPPRLAAQGPWRHPAGTGRRTPAAGVPFAN